MKDDYDLVLVRWRDSQIASGWDSPDEMRQRVSSIGIECRSVGWVFYFDEQRFVLISHQAENGSVAGAMVIPRRAIIDVRLLGIEDRPSGYGPGMPEGGAHDDGSARAAHGADEDGPARRAGLRTGE